MSTTRKPLRCSLASLLVGSAAWAGAQEVASTDPVPALPPPFVDWKAPAPAPVKGRPSLAPESGAAGLRAPGGKGGAGPDLSERPRGIERLHYQRSEDGRLWVRGRTYKAAFGDGRATYVPFLGEAASRNYPISFELREVSQGESSIPFEVDPEVRLEGDAVVFDRGSVQEIYELELDSIEQKFTFTEAPASGDLRVRMDVHTDLDMVADATGEVRFEGDLGRVVYSSALVVDSAGARVPIATHRQGPCEIELSVERDTLAQLAFPVTIDPVITTMNFGSSAIRQYKPDIAYDETYQRFLVVWEQQFSDDDTDVFSEFWSVDGEYLGVSDAIDITFDYVSDPSVANNNTADTFLIAAVRQPEGSGTWRQIHGRILHASGTFGPTFRIDDDGFSGDRIAPSVGGDPQSTGTTFFCVVYTRVYDSQDRDVFAQLVGSNGWREGGTILIDNSSQTRDQLPQVSRSNGRGNSGSQCWNVVWSRQAGIGDSDVYGAQLGRHGDILTPSFPIETSVYDERIPMVSSPLDENADGERPYVVTYTRQEAGPDVLCDVLVGSTRLEHTSIFGLGGGDELQPRTTPAVDSDGESFLIAFSEQYGTSSGDYDMYVVTAALRGSELEPVESRRPLATGADWEANPQLTSTYGSGGRRRRFMGVWTDANLPYDYDLEGAVYHAADPAIGSTYCVVAHNSAGGVPIPRALGSLRVADRHLTLEVDSLPPGVPGLFYFGRNAIQVPFGDGFRCVGGPTRRMHPFVHADEAGVVRRHVDFDASYAAALAPGSIYWQLWYRDTAAQQSGFNLSLGLHTLLVP